MGMKLRKINKDVARYYYEQGKTIYRGKSLKSARLEKAYMNRSWEKLDSEGYLFSGIFYINDSDTF
jgi:hypothetical protein